jgi:hypothetical protein
LSRQVWVGIDRNGNKVGKSIDDIESWINPVIRYENKPENPADRFSKMVRKPIGVVTEIRILEQPFDVKYLDHFILGTN